MKGYTSETIRNVALLGHGGCGKTTFLESALMATGVTRSWVRWKMEIPFPTMTRWRLKKDIQLILPSFQLNGKTARSIL